MSRTDEGAEETTVKKPSARASDQALLDRIQRDSFQYFVEQRHPGNGLIPDSTKPHAPCSIAAVGFGLSSYPVAVDRGWLTRAAARKLVLAVLRFFHGADPSGAADGVGYKGFFYHFLDMQTGRRAGKCELSTIDTELLVAGMLTCAQYFGGKHREEVEIRSKARAIYGRIDWHWAEHGGTGVSMGWRPERGFLRSRWVGYNESLILYVLALGSPTHPVEPAVYAHWLSGYRWKTLYGLAHVYVGPLFIHQFSHLWIDFRNIQDSYMADKGIDYFENSRRATYMQHEYAKRNPRGFESYHGTCWGVTASHGPGPATRMVHGKRRKFHGYVARGVPFGPDDGTVAPWASLASLPFAPELVVPTLRYLVEQTENPRNNFGFYASFNPSFHEQRGDIGWTSPWHYGLNQGPIVLMLENYRNGLIWRLMRGCEPVVRGLRRAGFHGGWLEHAP
jgi:hypothetical protein